MILFCLTGVFWIYFAIDTDWELVSQGSTPDSFSILSVHFFDQNEGIAISAMEIYKTSDAGKSLMPVFSDALSAFNSLYSHGNAIWITGSRRKTPQILLSDDRGVRWQVMRFEDSDEKVVKAGFEMFYDICVDNSGYLWVVGNGGIIKVLFGESRLKLLDFFPTEQSLFSIACSENAVWAVGEKGTIVKFEENWNQTKTNDDVTFTKVKVFENGVWLLGGNSDHGILLRGQNGRESWEDMTPRKASLLFDLHFQNEKGWLVGAHGKIFATSDNGLLWSESDSPTQADLAEIFALNSSNMWITGSRSVVLRRNGR